MSRNFVKKIDACAVTLTQLALISASTLALGVASPQKASAQESQAPQPPAGTASTETGDRLVA